MTVAVLAVSLDEMAEELRCARHGRRDYLRLNHAAVTRIADLLQLQQPAESVLADIRTVIAAFAVVDGEMFDEFEAADGRP